MTKFNIGIDNSGVVCSPNGGNVRGHANDPIVWESARNQFTLHFALISGKGHPSWPFTGEAQSVSQRAKPFEGTLAAVQDPKHPPAYKYTVVVDGYVPLDPIIIVDK
jgi:hypothetical protein